MPRQETEIRRLDVRIPIALFNQIRDLAIASGEPVHHRSGEVILAPTLLELVELGLKIYDKRGEMLDSDQLSPPPDVTVEILKRIEALEQKQQTTSVVDVDSLSERLAATEQRLNSLTSYLTERWNAIEKRLDNEDNQRRNEDLPKDDKRIYREAELKKLTNYQLKEIIKQLNLDLPPNQTKNQMINLILENQ